MKKLLLLIAILAGSMSFAQQEISSSQQELSKKMGDRIQAFKAQVDAKVVTIVKATNLEAKDHETLKEIVSTKESRLIRLEREGKDAENLQERRNKILVRYQKELKMLLGQEKYNLIESKK